MRAKPYFLETRSFLLLWALALGAISPLAALADDDVTPQDIRKITKALETATPGAAIPCPPESTSPSCAKISNDFCEKIWNPPNNGNLTLNGASIFLGRSKKSDLPMGTLLDLRAFIESEKKLPADLRARIAPALWGLKQLLDRESDEDTWHRKVQGQLRLIREGIEDVTEQRIKTKAPLIAATKRKDRTYEQRQFVDTEAHRLQSEILRAKYEHHPNWIRVTRNFERVRQDVLDEVTRMNLPSAKKQEILEKVRAMKIRLPYTDPSLVSPFPGCDRDTVNAFYMSDRNVFTVCAGWFNTMQDDASLAFVIGHEMGHSFDPNRQSVDSMMKTELGQALTRFCGVKGAAMPCAEWESLKKQVFQELPQITLPNPPFKALSSCLKPEEGLKPFDSAELKKIAETSARNSMNSFAQKNLFSTLAQPTVRKDGADIPNEDYFRPDHERDSGPESKCETEVLPELFTQSLECTGYRAASQEKRGELFERALSETQEMAKIINQHWYAHCGTDCSDLVPYKMGRSADEESADWLARRVFAKAVGRAKTLASRRQMLSTAAVWMCETPGSLWGAGDLTSREKKYSYEEHPDNRPRRLSLFTPEIVQLIDCTPDEEILQGNSSCDL